MPLRDHFHAPLDERHSWEGFHGGWPMKIVEALLDKLPAQYVAEPGVHLGAGNEVDIATFESNGLHSSTDNSENGGGTATAVYAPAQPILSLETNVLDADEYEVRIFDTKRRRRLVAAIEIVSPANKDRAVHRRAFVVKCAALLKEEVSVTMVDIVTSRSGNLGRELLAELGEPLKADHADLYATTIRAISKVHGHRIEVWEDPLALGRPLPIMPIWLSETLPFPLELEPSYERPAACCESPDSRPIHALKLAAQPTAGNSDRGNLPSTAPCG